MKKQWKDVLFCLLFCLMCLAPMIGMVIFGPSAAGANEVLVYEPRLIAKNGELNTDFLPDLSAWVRDRFGFRQELITANARLRSAVFGESATETVIVGEDGWLYYADTLGDYEGTSDMTDRQLWNAARTLALMEEYAASQGADFAFLPVPNKNTLYPEAMPDRYRQRETASNLSRLLKMLQEAGVTVCDLTEVLGAKEAPVYYQTDSHWDGYGSALAHDALLAVLGREGTLSEETFTEQPHQGDLTQMLYPASQETEPGLRLQRQRRFSYVGTVRGADDMLIRTTCQGQEGSLVMFRDSFGNLLHEDLAESFGTACFSRAMPCDLTLLEQEQAHTLVLEIVERNLPDLAKKAPVMKAPVRELTLPVQTVSAKVTMETKPCKLDGCVQYTGTVEASSMDEDSPIYLSLDGVVYEATPAGDTPFSFTLYAPEAQTADVLIRCGGVWMGCG